MIKSRPLAPGATATAALWLLSIPFAHGQATQLTSEQAFKNVTVLKGIPVDEFMDTMGFISASTNYNCADCHIEPKEEGDWSTYAQETPRKATARRMILMVQEINKNNFAGARVVTCYTCHRNVQGAPKITPSLAEQYGEPPTPDPNEVEIRRQRPDAPSADQVFDKYLQAVGGAQKAAAIASIVFKGAYTGYAEPQSPVDIYVKAPNQRTMIVHTDSGDRTTTCDGANGWMAAPATDKPFPVIRYTGGDLDGVRLDAVLSLPAGIKQAITRPVVGLSMIDDKDVVVVQGTATGGRSPVKLYFDKASGLLVRQVRYADTMIGRVPVQVDYSDYRDAAGAGVKLPFHVITTWTDGRSDVLLTSAETNVAIDAAKFNQPSPPAPRKK
ncbi:MAG: photosynthetic reaction center cytochrome c subunit [Bryobacterales bacterium]|nr:photosynthetic reaction center cytochrome c subunit [Bryobacterales bacterium]MBV9399355.1 photosynthetic reaction center cytochrome c subunit [Bryobacterales bacterium]